MLCSWTDYYSGSGTEYSQQTGRLTSFTGTAYIKNSFFNELSISGNGGSIYYSSSSSLLMLIESTTFIKSKSTSTGGAIYFASSGQFVMAKVCGSGCETTSSSYHFDYIQVTNSISSKNEVYDSSICRTNQPSRFCEMYHYYGKVVFKQTNISSNLCHQVTSIRSNPTSNGNMAASTFSYLSITDNIDTLGYTVYLSSSCLYEIDSCNFISNTDKTSNRAIIITDGSLNLRGSCIINNAVPYAIENRGGYSVTVTNCTIDSSIRYSGAVSILSTPKTSFINNLKHIETALCYAVIPVTTKTSIYEIPNDQMEMILDKYCNKHMTVNLIRVLSYLFVHSFIS
jgi:hypothetical protein